MLTETKITQDNKNVELILQEGWRLFEKKGFRGASIDELCMRCNLSKPTVYYYFHNKENLFVQVLRHKLSGFREVIEQPGTLTERLERISTSILDNFQAEYSTLMRDREHIKQPKALQEVKEAFHSELFGPLIALMRLGIDRGELDGDNPEVLTLIFLGSINNFIGKASDMHLPNADLARIITSYFLDGAKKNE
ncbi:MAG: TetR/AcrR family transcriptional regulator [Anaerolineaceae bacterium]|nr:TetR/AcrR family transcriptional regulator [Anaerolineaceae bacterium]